MGFLDGIRDVLGGFNAVKRIDDTGFDWREQDAAQQFARDRQVEEARQQDEDRAVNQIADAYAGAEGGQEPDVSPLLQGIEQRRQKFMLDRARGVGKERKSALEDQKTYRTIQQQAMRGQQGLDLVDARGAEAQEAIRLREKLRSGQGLSPREQAMLDAADRRVAAQQAGANWRDQNGPAGGGNGGGGRWAWNTETNASEWVTPEKLYSAPPGMYTDPVSGRQGAGQQTNKDAMGRITGNLDSALTNYERTQEGMGRVVPSFASPDKAVAWDRYQSALQSAGQAFGRKVLNDTRVSNEDRQAYAKTIGQTSELMTMLDPTEARRRMQLLMENEADYEAKYGGAQPPRSPRAPRGGGSVDPRNLKPGDIYKGMRYKGGPKGSPNSWEQP